MGIFFSPMFIICYTKPKIWEHSGLQTCLLFPLQSFHIALVLHKLIINKSCGEPFWAGMGYFRILFLILNFRQAINTHSIAGCFNRDTLSFLLWQYGLQIFQAGGTELCRKIFHKNQYTQRKLLNSEFWINGELSKIGHHFSNTVI